MGQNILERFSNMFSVKDVMTPTDQLKRADGIETATYLFHEYDVVPYPRTGPISGYFIREKGELISVEPDLLISDGTSLFELPGLLSSKPFYFVTSVNTITGYVHYSDLNRPAMKIPFFILFQTMERDLWDKVKGRITEKDLPLVFRENETKKYAKKRRKAVADNVDVGWTGIFAFPAILKLSRHFELNHLLDEEIELLTVVRNHVAHSDNNLVSSYKDVETLARAYELFRANLPS